MGLESLNCLLEHRRETPLRAASCVDPCMGRPLDPRLSLSPRQDSPSSLLPEVLEAGGMSRWWPSCPSCRGRGWWSCFRGGCSGLGWVLPCRETWCYKRRSLAVSISSTSGDTEFPCGFCMPSHVLEKLASSPRRPMGSWLREPELRHSGLESLTGYITQSGSRALTSSPGAHGEPW